jgi:hypothetical protein
MNTFPTSVQIPAPLYRRLERVAQLTRHPIEEVVTRALESSVPSLPDDLPAELRDQLLALENLSDDELWQIARSTLNDAQQTQLHTLLERNRAGMLATAEQTLLEQLQHAADQLTLRKAYAYVLLKWRGYRLPTLDELATA